MQSIQNFGMVSLMCNGFIVLWNQSFPFKCIVKIFSGDTRYCYIFRWHKILLYFQVTQGIAIRGGWCMTTTRRLGWTTPALTCSAYRRTTSHPELSTKAWRSETSSYSIIIIRLPQLGCEIRQPTTIVVHLLTFTKSSIIYCPKFHSI